jgi:hypothetical protein
MSHLYEIVSGRLYDPDGILLGVGYSGAPAYKNNPDAQSLVAKGPIPAGIYVINAPVDSPVHGPFAMPLTPDPANLMWGRSGFLLHGDSLVAPGTASEGCIIQSRDVREKVWSALDHVLQVVVYKETTP